MASDLPETPFGRLLGQVRQRAIADDPTSLLDAASTISAEYAAEGAREVKDIAPSIMDRR
jgi:hypothetical protein